MGNKKSRKLESVEKAKESSSDEESVNISSTDEVSSNEDDEYTLPMNYKFIAHRLQSS